MNTTSTTTRLIAILCICFFSTSLSAQELRKRTPGGDGDGIGGFKAKLLDVIYVDNQSSPGGTGSKANPVDTIQDGVDAAFYNNAKIVVVRGGGPAYSEDVTVLKPNGLSIYGDGVDISCDKENPYAGKGGQPVLEGGFYVEDIPFFTLIGLTIYDGFEGENGVELVDVEKVQVTGNHIYRTGEGTLATAAVLLWSTENVEADYVVSCNQILENYQTGISMYAADDSKVTASFTNNNFVRNRAVALKMYLFDASAGKIRADNNSISGDGVFLNGMSVHTSDTAQASFEIVGNHLEFVGHTALTLSARGNSKADFLATKNSVRYAAGGAAFVGASDTADVNALFNNNTLTESGSGFRVRSSDFGVVAIKVEGNLVAGNDSFGFQFAQSDFGLLEVEGKVSNNTLPGNSGNEVQFTGVPDGSFVLNGSVVVLPVTIP